MRVETSPQRVSAAAGRAATFTITVTNTGSVIGGYRIRALGVDPRWAELDTDSLSLFPDDTGVAVLTVALPPGLPAGPRLVTVEVVESTPPGEVARVDLELIVPAVPGVDLAVEPGSITSGRAAAVAVTLANTGNAPLELGLVGRDDAGAIDFAFDPPVPALEPGDTLIATARLRAHRPWFGNPKIRPFSVEAGPPGAPVVGMATWIQKPRFSRGAVALAGLLAAATVFAVVIAATLSQVVHTSTADRDLALQVAQAAQSGSSAVGTSSLSGTVAQLTSGRPVSGVTVELFPAADPTTPVLSTATDASGGYHFSGLAAGGYKLRFSGAGFAQVWYPAALTPDAAKAVQVDAGKTVGGLDVHLGGTPGSISGTVVGGDPTGAVLTLEVPPAAGAATAGTSPAAAATSSATGAGGASPAVVATQTLDAGGAFSFGNVPSPATYALSISAPGYATTTDTVDLAGGQARTGVVVTLHKGDGAISGTVAGASGPIGGATVAASTGTTTVSTVSATTPGAVGGFRLVGLPTPATVTVTVSAPGYASQTLALTLAGGQQLSGVAVTLTPGTGSIAGTVAGPAGPLGGVTVTATDGKATQTTVTLSQGAVGSYTLSGLTVPDTYTVTFSGTGLASQTQSIALPRNGSSALTGVDVTMQPSTATIEGLVTDATSGTPLAEVAITLTSGPTTYKVTSAETPLTVGGTKVNYEVDGITPGTYTVTFTRPGGVPNSFVRVVTAGQVLVYNAPLAPAASIVGTVGTVVNGQFFPVGGVQVLLYEASTYPSTPITSVLTGADGTFTISSVDAPHDYILGFAYPQGATVQVTTDVRTLIGQKVDTCAPAPGQAAQTACSTAADPADPAGSAYVKVSTS